jgi:DNA-binding transcriptional LysR family regulator
MNIPNKVELRHLRYFVAVAENAGFTAAARQVRVSQQVLSTQVRQLEDELGVELLRRGPRGAELTPAGTVFLDSARSVLDGLDRGRRWPASWRWRRGFAEALGFLGGSGT